MPALAQESITKLWRVDRNGYSHGYRKGSTSPTSPTSPSSPLSTSPTPRIGFQRIPSSVFLQASRSLSPTRTSRPAPTINPLSWILNIILNASRNLLSTLFYLLWSQILIGPTLWVSAWLWLFWKCVSLPLTIVKCVLTVCQTSPVERLRRKRTVLISGGSTVQGLHLARNFYSAGARVVMCEVDGLFGLTRFSTAVDKFYTVPKPTEANAQHYVNAICSIVEKENVSYYIPVSATNEAFYDALAKPRLELLSCHVFCPSLRDVLFLDDILKVLSRCRTVGIATPLYYHITAREDLMRLYDNGYFTKVLHGTTRHVMTSVGPEGVRERVKVSVPPFRQDLDQSLEMSHQRPWVIVQDLKGDHYVTCTTVKEGQVVANVTCLVEKDGGGLLPVEKDEITVWMQNFFDKLKLGHVSGHFSFRFVVSHASGTVVPLDCKTGISLPYICFTSVHPRIVWKPCRHFSRQSSGPLVVDTPRYWMHDAVLTTLRHPSVEAVTKLIGTVLDKREALFVYWDPLPYCAYYHLQLPFRNILNFLQGQQARNPRHHSIQRTLTPPVHL